MRSGLRPRAALRPRFGLRPKLVLALVAVALVALAGPAIELLAPLQKELTSQTLGVMRVAGDRLGAELSRLPASQLHPDTHAVNRLARRLRREDFDVTIVDSRGRYLFGWDDDVQRMVKTGTVPRVGSWRHQVFAKVYGWGPWARVVVTAHAATGTVAIAVYRSLQEAQTARDALIDGLERAGAVSLLIAIALGFALASRIVLRTHRLRDAALRVAAQGPSIAPPDDDREDEIGDLARAFRVMQRRWRAQEQARETFVATASHELRTPLTALQLRLGLLQEDLAGERPDLADAAEQVALAEAQARRLSKLASDLLDLSRLDAEVSLRHVPVELGPIARGVVAEFQGIAGPAVVLDEAETGTVLGDPDRLTQIVRILIDNARRYSPADAQVRVRVLAATVTVEDDGSGVSGDEREMIFERFSRGSQQDQHSGFGLGLAIGRELARLMGGDLLLVNSVLPTRFELRLQADPHSIHDPERPLTADSR